MAACVARPYTADDNTWDFFADKLTEKVFVNNENPEETCVSFWLMLGNRRAFAVLPSMLSQKIAEPAEGKICIDDITMHKRCERGTRCHRAHLTRQAITTIEKTYGVYFGLQPHARSTPPATEVRRILGEFYKGLMHAHTVPQHVLVPTCNTTFPYNCIHRTWVSDFALAVATNRHSTPNGKNSPVLLANILPATERFTQVCLFLALMMVHTIDDLDRFALQIQYLPIITDRLNNLRRFGVQFKEDPRFEMLSLEWFAILRSVTQNEARMCHYFEINHVCAVNYGCCNWHLWSDTKTRKDYNLPYQKAKHTF